MYAIKSQSWPPSSFIFWRITRNVKIVSAHKHFMRLFIHTAVHVPSYGERELDSFVAKCSSMTQIKTLHAQMILRGLGDDNISISRLILLCAMSSFGDREYADDLFDKIRTPNRYIFNTLIRASVNDGKASKALLLYRKMAVSGIFPNEFTFPFILKACGFLKALLDGLSVHLQALKLGFSECYTCVQNGLINLYVSCDKIEFAVEIFNSMDFKTLVSWNSMIAGYAKIGKCREAILMFSDMRSGGVEPDGHTLASLLSISSKIINVELGKFLHWYIEINGVVSDAHLENALLDMYAKCSHLHIAEAIFARMANKSVVSWTSILSAYSKHGLVESAETTFNQMPVKNVISWNSMITCYLQNGEYQKSLELFHRMLDSSVVPDQTTIASALSACSQLGDIVTGKKLHEYLCANAVEPTITSYNALVDMYARCGFLETAMDLFQNMSEKNIVSWNTMINALAFHGQGHRAIELFQQMEANEEQPDAVTFSGLLSACCHCGLTDTGQLLFHKMSNTFNIPYQLEHYACMVDLLGRRGLFEEALNLISGMSMRPDTVIWGALLSACRAHRKVGIAKLILKQLLEVEPYSGGLYVLVSNIFSDCQHWDEVKKMWILMSNCCVHKNRGLSSIEVCT